MIRIITLIEESPEAHGVLDAKLDFERKMPCEVRSVGMNEVYQARATGMMPEIRAVLPYSSQYHGEKRCIIGNTEYEIIRTYTTEQNEIELTLQRARGNAAAPMTGGM